MTHDATDTRWRDAEGEIIDEEDRGLVYDIRTLVDRRKALGLFGGIAATSLLAACSASPTPTASASASSSATATATATPEATATSEPLTEVPDETGGPFPGDGSNGVNVLDDSGVVRSDIRSSFGSSTTTAPGVPLNINLTVREAATGNAMAGAAVYLWHCTRDGDYSLYSSGVENENYLRGVQEADATGTVRFTSIFPGAYQGRWPHIHFEVYPSLDDATSASNKLRTTQLALPEETSAAIYETDGYDASVANLAQTSLDTDNVFSDGYSLQLAKVTGSVGDGLTATLTVPV